MGGGASKKGAQQNSQPPQPAQPQESDDAQNPRNGQPPLQPKEPAAEVPDSQSLDQEPRRPPIKPGSGASGSAVGNQEAIEASPKPRRPDASNSGGDKRRPSPRRQPSPGKCEQAPKPSEPSSAKEAEMPEPEPQVPTKVPTPAREEVYQDQSFAHQAPQGPSPSGSQGQVSLHSQAESPSNGQPPPHGRSSPQSSVQEPTPQPSPKYEEPDYELIEGESLLIASRTGDAELLKAYILRFGDGEEGIVGDRESLFDDYGDSVLHHSVQSGSNDCVELLLRYGRVQVDIPNVDNVTPLQLACRAGFGLAVQTLLQHNADPNHRDHRGITPFFAAVFSGAGTQLLELLCSASAEVSEQDNHGVSALHFAALKEDVALMEWLVLKGANINAMTELQTTPIMLSAKRGHLKGISLLLRASANTNTQDEAGCTALMLALSSDHLPCALALLSGMASVILVDNAGRNALFYAIFSQNLEAVQGVVGKGARINMLDEEGRSPLYQACLMGDRSIVLHLLEHDADPNLAGRGDEVKAPAAEDGEDGGEGDAVRRCLEEARMCLQACCVLEHNDLIGPLLEKKAQIDAALGPFRWTALHLCAVMSNDEGAAKLVKHGAVGSLQDVDGNTAVALAERMGHTRMIDVLRIAAMSNTGSNSTGGEAHARRVGSMAGALPPIHQPALTEKPGEEDNAEPLENFRKHWQTRDSDGSLLDLVLGCMIHDAFKSDQWRFRWEALTYVTKNTQELKGSPKELISAVALIVVMSSQDKVQKVFSASLLVLEELVSDARAEDIPCEEFVKLLDTEQGNVLEVLLDATEDSKGGQSAMDTICSCALSGHVALDDVMVLLLERMDQRLSGKSPPGKNEKAEHTSKKLATNFKLMDRCLTAFGLQQAGLFRRAIVLPLLLRGASSSHSKVRSPAGEVVVKLLTISGGLEERVWKFLTPKVQKAIKQLAETSEGVALVAEARHEEDKMPRDVIASEDKRASQFLCMSELTAAKWAELTADGETDKASKSSPTKKRESKSKDGKEARSSKGGDKTSAPNEAPKAAPAIGVLEEDAETLWRSVGSKNWKDRAECLTALLSDISGLSGVQMADGPSSGPLSQYVLKDHRLSVLQEVLVTLLPDPVIAVFLPASDLVQMICQKVPLMVAPLFLEPLMPLLLTRMLDTSGRVKTKANECLEKLAEVQEGALSELIAQSVISKDNWGALEKKDKTGEKNMAARLQLLGRIVIQKPAAKWTDETWEAVVDLALTVAEHRSNDVRHLALALLAGVQDASDKAFAIAQRGISQLELQSKQRIGKLQRMKEGMPLVPGERPDTSASRPGTGARPGTNATSRIDTGLVRQGTSAGRPPPTGSRPPTGSTGSRPPGTGAGPPGTGARQGTAATRVGTGNRPNTGTRWQAKMIDWSSDEEDEAPKDPNNDSGVFGDTICSMASLGGEDPDSVVMFDVPSTNAPSQDPHEALALALPMAEPIDEMAVDFVAPLVELFGEEWTRCFYSRHWQCRTAALSHLAGTIEDRALTAGASAPDLLDGAMRTVHEGLGDQNVKVYSESCRCMTAVVPPFVEQVDGRLLIAHLAPLLKQLCVRMGDAKEIVRTQTTEALFRLLQPPTGQILSPGALATLILRHLVTAPSGSSPKSGEGKGAKGAVVGWLCRLSALRRLVKDHQNNVIPQGLDRPREWLVLSEGMAHMDPTVRHASTRLFVMACKAGHKNVDDEAAQNSLREKWCAALPSTLQPKIIDQVRKMLNLPETAPDTESGAGNGAAPSKAPAPSSVQWEVPPGLSEWSGIDPDRLAILRTDPGNCFELLQGLLRAMKEAPKPQKIDLIFTALLSVVKQILSVGDSGNRMVFLGAIQLFQMAVQIFAPKISGLDVNIGLGKVFPVLLDKASFTGDMKVAMASDKLVRLLAKHQSVGCEAVTKMVISAVSRAAQPSRPLVWLSTLLGDFQGKLCGQSDIVALLVDACGAQLERLQNTEAAQTIKDSEQVMKQIIGVLGLCKWADSDTLNECVSKMRDAAIKPLLRKAISEVPDKRHGQVVLGSEKEDSQFKGIAQNGLGNASGNTGKPPEIPNGLDASPGQKRPNPGRRPRLEATENSPRQGAVAPTPTEARTPKYSFDNTPSPYRDQRKVPGSEQPPPDAKPNYSAFMANDPNGDTARHVQWANKSPPKPDDMGRPSAAGHIGAVAGGAQGLWRNRREGGENEQNLNGDNRAGTSEGRIAKRAAVAERKKKREDDSLDALMDVLTKIEKGRHTR